MTNPPGSGILSSMRLSKYAEWVDLRCGECRILVDIGSIVEWKIDSSCRDHETVKCLECGESTQRAVPMHGTLGGLHKTRFEEG